MNHCDDFNVSGSFCKLSCNPYKENIVNSPPNFFYEILLMLGLFTFSKECTFP